MCLVHHLCILTEEHFSVSTIHLKTNLELDLGPILLTRPNPTTSEVTQPDPKLSSNSGPDPTHFA